MIDYRIPDLLIRKISYFFLFFCFSCCTPNKQPKEFQVEKIEFPEIVMHKGLHLGGKLAPENSLQAIRYAAKTGAKYVELDVNITADHKLILFHDDLLNDLCRNIADYSVIENEVKCTNLTYSELIGNYVLASAYPEFRTPVPSLEEALLLCDSLGLFPLIEIKQVNFTKLTVQKVYDQAVETMGKGNFEITSFGRWVMKYLRKIDPELDLYCDMVQDYKFLSEYKINYYPHYYNFDMDLINKIQKSGLKAVTWTVEKEHYNIVSGANFNMILTDNIATTFQPEKAIFETVGEDLSYNFHTDGNIDNGIVFLKEGESFILKDSIVPDTVFLGANYFIIEAKGKFEIAANGFFHQRHTLSENFDVYRYQYFYHNEKPYFSIKSLNDSTSIKSAWFATCKFE